MVCFSLVSPNKYIFYTFISVAKCIKGMPVAKMGLLMSLENLTKDESYMKEWSWVWRVNDRKSISKIHMAPPMLRFWNVQKHFCPIITKDTIPSFFLDVTSKERATSITSGWRTFEEVDLGQRQRQGLKSTWYRVYLMMLFGHEHSATVVFDSHIQPIKSKP